uniref:5-hydroxytryptamine (serotonin) receptor 3A n=1 Tax=Sinocyclocheilus anshuiensis TaxID=1608454 RepID=A0A671QAH8_9TELE
LRKQHFSTKKTSFPLLQSADTINCSQPTAESLLQALRESVFNKTEVRPVINPRTPTKIHLGFILYAVLDVDEKAQILDTFIWLQFVRDWTIEGLSWDPVECGIDRITLPRKKLWRPDIVINEFDNQAPNTYYLYLYNNGKAEDRLPVHLISSCNLDIYTFPFDIQNCTYTFGSYKHTIRDVQILFSEPVEATLKKSLQYMETKGEWQLTDMIARKSIVLKRRPTLYVVNLLIPSYCLITVDLFSFLLPPQKMDRSAFKMTLILGYTVFLLLMNDLLPVTGDTIPLINVFFSLCLALMVASLLETIVVTNILCGSSDYPPLPNWVKVLFLHYLARLVCLPENTKATISCSLEKEISQIRYPEKGIKSPLNHDEQELKELRNIHKDVLTIRQQVDKHFSTDQNSEEWIHLGEVIDRFLFALYVIFLTVSFFTILIFWLYWYSFDKKS